MVLIRWVQDAGKSSESCQWCIQKLSESEPKDTMSCTYARARLWTGIAGVGTVVVLATVLLAIGAPSWLLEGRGGNPPADALLLFFVLALGALVVLPFDVVGGFVLPNLFGRPVPMPRCAAAWLRGVLVVITLSTSSGTILLAAGRAGGRPAALAIFVVIAVLMVLLQEPIARLVGGLRRLPVDRLRELGADPTSVVFLEGTDPGFSGGFTGFSSTMVLPARWLHRLEPRALALLIERRRRILRSGAWRRSLIVAILWNALGFAIASYLPNAGVRTVSELVATALGFTLWTFFGLLLLPTPSRRATVSADALVAGDEQAREQLEEAVQVLDKLQDDEPERSPGLESVFHPVPSVGNRVRALAGSDARKPGAWHLARTALYLSHVGLSQLPRMVHCNVGRPELWVYLPTDG